MPQDGRQEARVFARKHFLSEQTLEMLVDMRWQFACMLADSKLVSGSPRKSKGREWMDDPKQPFNAHASKQAVVCCHYCEGVCKLQLMLQLLTSATMTPSADARRGEH